MFTLDSDLLGLLMALLTFFIPVITSIMEKRKKKRKEETSALQPGGEDYVQEKDKEDFLPDESLHFQHQPALAEDEEPQYSAASELEELFNDILGINVQQHNDSEGNGYSSVEDMIMAGQPSAEKFDDVVLERENEEKFLEGEAVTAQAKEPVEPVGEDIFKEIPQEDKGLKKRIKENPKDMMILAEILKPKFKEY